MKSIENLTEIDTDAASRLLTEFTSHLGFDDETESSSDETISVGELDIISSMLKVNHGRYLSSTQIPVKRGNCYFYCIEMPIMSMRSWFVYF